MICDLCQQESGSTEWINGYWICDDDAFRIHNPEELSDPFDVQRDMGWLTDHEVEVLTAIGVLDARL